MRCSSAFQVISLLLLLLISLQVMCSAVDSPSSRRRSRDGAEQDGRRRNPRRLRSGQRRRDRGATETPPTSGGVVLPALDTTEPPVCGRDCMYTRDLRRHHRLEAIKEDILHKLKLDAPVNVTNRSMPRVPVISQILETMETMQGDEPSERRHHHHHHYDFDDEDGDRSTTHRVFNFAEQPPADLQANDSQSCYFKFSNDVLGSSNTVHSATLGVFVKRPANLDNHVTYILVYVRDPHSASAYTLLHQKKISLNPEQTSKWYEFDLTRHVNLWIHHPYTNKGVKIMASDSQGNPLAIVTPQSTSEEPYKPYLEMKMRAAGRKRTKRRLRLDCDETSNETRCCRYPLEIDFTVFDWDFIIAPRRYSAYYCAGECPFVYFQKYPHTHVFENAKPKDAGGPCCSPERLSPLRLLYFDEDLQIKIDTLPGMVVERCACAS